MFIWTIGDVIGLSLIALFVGAYALVSIWDFVVKFFKKP